MSRHYTSAFSPNTSFDAGLGRHEASRSLDDAAAGPPRRPARGTSDDPVMVFDDDEGKRVDHPIEVG